MINMVFVGMYEDGNGIINYFKESLGKLGFEEEKVRVESLSEHDNGFIGYMVNVLEKKFVRINLSQYSVGSPRGVYRKKEDIDHFISKIIEQEENLKVKDKTVSVDKVDKEYLPSGTFYVQSELEKALNHLSEHNRIIKSLYGEAGV